MRLLSRAATAPLIQQALHEDAAAHDVTSRATLPATLHIRARIVAHAPGVLAGGPLALQTFTMADRSLRCRLVRAEGSTLTKGSTVLTVTGTARSIFAAERTALNLLAHLSGIATLTAEFVRRTRGTRARILDTRKMLPGLRLIEKYAVRVGGGVNHRADLQEAILIKTNHLRALGQETGDKGQGKVTSLICEAVAQARRVQPRRFVEIEVANISEFQAALAARPDAILLDNWNVKAIRKAVLLARKPTPHAPPARLLREPGRARLVPLLEVSGGVTLSNIRAIAQTGVDHISIGRLTHSASSLDLSLEVL